MSAFQKQQEKYDATRKNAGGKCLFCMKVLKLSKRKQRELYEAMIDKSIMNQTIVDVLQGWDVDTSVTTVSTHRSGTQGRAEHMMTIKKAAGL